MPLWGNSNSPSGANKPKFGFPKYMGMPNVSPGANGANTFGVTVAGMTDASSFNGKPPGHAGWQNMIKGRGFVNAVVSILAAGNNIANLSYSIAVGGNGSGANLQVTSVNGNGSVGNVLTVAVRARGADYNAAPNVVFVPTVVAAAGNSYVSLEMGGRVGRNMNETLVAMGSLTGTDPTANVFYANNA